MSTTTVPFGITNQPVTATPESFPLIMTTAESIDAEREFAAYADEVRAFVLRFWQPPSSASLDFLVLWIIGTHLRGRDGGPFMPESFPLLMLGSTGPESGKTTALKMAIALAHRGQMMADVTAPAALNHAEQRRSLGFDEYDTLIGAGAGSRNLRAHMLASYDTGGTITRAQGKGDTRDVDVHYPIAFAGMIKTFATHPSLSALRTRTIVLHCKPATPGPDGVMPETFRSRHTTHATQLREVMAAWGLANAPRVVARAEYIPMPDGVHNRSRQLWETLFSLAEAIGGDWPERAAVACDEIVRGVPGEEDLTLSPVEWLLRDLAHVFTEPRMTSAALVEGLVNLPGSPWLRWLNADPESAAVSGGKQLAAMLAERGVKPRAIKLNGTTVRGYKRDDLIAAGMPDGIPAPTDAPADAPADDVADAPAPRAKRTPRKRNPGPKPAHGRPAVPPVS